MSLWSLIARSAGYYLWRTHFGVVLGAAVATAVLVGALAVGDSVRLSLRAMALSRVGHVDLALTAGERFCRADLADRIGQEIGAQVVPALQLRGVVSAAGGASRAGIVDVYGVDSRFSGLWPAPSPWQGPGPGEASLNAQLAHHLGVGHDDTVVLRVEQPSALPRDMAMATVDDVSLALRLQVTDIVDSRSFGRFSLRASQVPPFSVFVSRAWLAEQLGLAERANLLLLAGDGEDLVARANEALRARWTIEDAELRIATPAGAELFELTSSRIFLDPPVIEAVERLEPKLLGVMTYFVNELRSGERATPYSMVSAIGPLSSAGGPPDAAVQRSVAFLPGQIAVDEIVLNAWCADDLGAAAGDPVELHYFVMGPQLTLERRSHRFAVRGVVPIAGLASDPGLMPAFPGLVDTDNCRDWEPGIPIDLDRIRDKDEEYWDEHRGTPKAFVALSQGRQLWGNRFGSLTAVRGPQRLAARIRDELPRTLDPASVGLFFRDLRGPALAAGTSATDFGGLFAGLSFFLIIAALLLTSLLFVFGVEQRAAEIGVLLAVGFRPRTVRRLFLGEALVLATAGGVLGAGLGLLYTQAVLIGLGTLWRDAVGATTLSLYVQPATVVGGAVGAVLASALAIAWALRKTFAATAVALLSSRQGVPSAAEPVGRRRGLSFWVAVICPLAAMGIILAVGPGSAQAAGAFFGAGALLLVGGLAACRRLLRGAAGSASYIASVGALGVRNAGRRPGRSLATIALLACGTFLVVAVQAYRLEPPRDVYDRASGTGGFALYGRSSLPVLRDLGSEAGREAYGLDGAELEGVDLVPLRVRDGDDASCLNLSLPQNPRLLGVRAGALAERRAFRFADAMGPEGGAPDANPWALLDADYGADVVPAIGDQASITWVLHKKIGDTIRYRDERGREFDVLIVGAVTDSILQGNLVISERSFEERFPSASGYGVFLIDAPAERSADVATQLTRAFEDMGLEITPTDERLRAFQAVQNTYLLIFQALGGLGLLLGTVGLGVVVLRNALERRNELAVASALGFSARSVRRLVSSEHGLLLGLGMCTGVGAALVAVLPGLGGGLPWGSIVLLVVAVAASGAVWVWLASAVATRGSLLGALQDD